MDQDLHFVFITGVTKFSRMGVFSALNNLVDISLSPEFASFVGFTHAEISDYFNPFIKETAAALQMSEPELLKGLQDYYDGFSFDGLTRLYNPFSTLNFFQDKKFKSFWMESGSNALIREMLKDKGLMVEQFRGLKVGEDFAAAPGEIEKTPSEGFLYQAGYLTLRKDLESRSSYYLDYPNFEVLSSMSRLFIDMVFDSELEAYGFTSELKKHVEKGDVTEILNQFMRLYATITYDDHTAIRRLNLSLSIANNLRAEVTRQIIDSVGAIPVAKLTRRMKMAIKDNDFEMAENILGHLINASDRPREVRLKLSESFYRANLQSYLLGAGVKVVSELHNNLGRSDLIIDHSGRHYVIEIKVVEKSEEAEKAAEKAINQIIDRGYDAPYPDPILLGLAISEEERNIAACVCVENKKARKLTIDKPQGYDFTNMK
jgi:hypothetical protein